MAPSVSACRKNLLLDSEISNIRSYWKYSKGTICQAYEKEYWKLSGYERTVREEYCSTKEKDLTTIQVLATRDGKRFCKKRFMMQSGIPPSIREETSYRVLQKIDLKWTHFQRKGILSKNDMKLRLKFALKVCCKHAMCNFET